MSKLCPNCCHIGKGRFSKFNNDWFFGSNRTGIVLIIIGLYYSFFRWRDEAFDPIMFSFTMLGVLFGVFCIIQYYRGGNFCPKCGKQPMLSLDKPEAIKIIKERDLSIPEKSSPQST